MSKWTSGWPSILSILDGGKPTTTCSVWKIALQVNKGSENNVESNQLTRFIEAENFRASGFLCFSIIPTYSIGNRYIRDYISLIELIFLLYHVFLEIILIFIKLYITAYIIIIFIIIRVFCFKPCGLLRSQLAYSLADLSSFF